MLDRKFADHFATEWISAWNAHDLRKVLSHYTETFEMTSPLIAEIAGERSGRLTGKAAVAAYWSKALQVIPDLHFELLHTLIGVDSVVLFYKAARGLAAEACYFDANGKVSRASAHYE